MNWGEFKAAVEAKGVKDDVILGYIDVSYPREVWEIAVDLHQKGELPPQVNITDLGSPS